MEKLVFRKSFASGIEVLGLWGYSCRVVVVPRRYIFSAESETGLDLHKPAMYILLESLEREQDGEPVNAYIGHADDFIVRVGQHYADPRKCFFNYAIAVQSTDGSMGRAEVQYLEAWAIVAARHNKDFNMSHNRNTPLAPSMPLGQLVAGRAFANLAAVLLGAVRCPILECRRDGEWPRTHTDMVVRSSAPKRRTAVKCGPERRKPAVCRQMCVDDGVCPRLYVLARRLVYHKKQGAMREG